MRSPLKCLILIETIALFCTDTLLPRWSHSVCLRPTSMSWRHSLILSPLSAMCMWRHWQLTTHWHSFTEWNQVRSVQRTHCLPICGLLLRMFYFKQPCLCLAEVFGFGICTLSLWRFGYKLYNRSTIIIETMMNIRTTSMSMKTVMTKRRRKTE